MLLVMSVWGLWKLNVSDGKAKEVRKLVVRPEVMLVPLGSDFSITRDDCKPETCAVRVIVLVELTVCEMSHSNRDSFVDGHPLVADE
jgi:hypothetical protein